VWHRRSIQRWDDGAYLTGVRSLIAAQLSGMADILHRIGVEQSSPQQVYDALTTLDGLSGWWTETTFGDTDLGGVIEFRFGPGGFDMKVAELDPDRLGCWDVVDGSQEWIGTRQLRPGRHRRRKRRPRPARSEDQRLALTQRRPTRIATRPISRPVSPASSNLDALVVAGFAAPLRAGALRGAQPGDLGRKSRQLASAVIGRGDSGLPAF
jgi:hypothetical protein